MKITIHQLNQIIKEEISKAVNEAPPRRRLRPLRPVASATQPKTSIPATQAPAAAPAKPAAPAPKTFSTGDSKLDAWIEKQSGGPNGGVAVLGFDHRVGKKTSMRIKDQAGGEFVIMPKGIQVRDLSVRNSALVANPADVLGVITRVGNGSVVGVRAIPVGLSDPGEFMVAPSEDLKKPEWADELSKYKQSLPAYQQGLTRAKAHRERVNSPAYKAKEAEIRALDKKKAETKMSAEVQKLTSQVADTLRNMREPTSHRKAKETWTWDEIMDHMNTFHQLGARTFDVRKVLPQWLAGDKESGYKILDKPKTQ
tara:strand:- start:113 stop:1045 length:933 start_codon:yes stop_codon:yes gene_type:complete